MWSLETLEYLNREAARKARRGKREPQVVSAEEIDNFPPFRFPNLGPYVPAGWEPVDDACWFVDSSGWGRNDEPVGRGGRHAAAFPSAAGLKAPT